MANILDRRSIRKYDEKVKISKTEIIQLLNEAARAPSNMNMQPWRFAVVTSREGKERLKPVLYGNEIQLNTSAAMICIFTDLKKFEYTEKIFDMAVYKGLMPVDVRDRQVKSITNLVPNLSNEELIKTNNFDAGLFSMNLMHVARNHGYDTCPIGGYRHDKLAQAVGLDEKRYIPALILSIGKKAEEGFESLRLDADELTVWL